MDRKIDKLAEILKATDTKPKYDIVESLEQLQQLYGTVKAK